MSILWSNEDGRRFERKHKPGMFISGKDLLLFFGRVVLATLCLAVAAWAFVVLWFSL